jgi:hypothetical protein
MLEIYGPVNFIYWQLCADVITWNIFSCTNQIKKTFINVFLNNTTIAMLGMPRTSLVSMSFFFHKWTSLK